MKNKKGLEDTQELDANEIRKASSAPKKKSQSKRTQGSVQGKKAVSNNSKKPAPKKQPQKAKAPQKQTAGASKNPANSKIRYFPQVEQKKNTKKKIKIDKKLARKIKGILVFSLIAVILVTSVVIFGIYQIFKIRSVTINYDFEKSSKSEVVKRRYTDEQIKKAGEIEIGDNLVFFNIEKKAEKINEVLPYLQISSIDKKGFSKLIINAKQIKPKYSFQNGATYILTNENFEVIDETNNKKEASKYTLITNTKIKSGEIGHTVVFGDKDKKNKDKDADALYENEIKSVLSAVGASGIKKITYINLKNLNDIYMVYDNRITIRCGEKGTLTDKLKLALKTLEAEDKNSQIQTGFLNLTIDKKAYFTPD